MPAMKIEDVIETLEKDIEEDIARMNRETDRFFRWAKEAASKRPGPGGPFVLGYSATLGEDGKLHFEHFGNVPAKGGRWEPYTSTSLDERAGKVRLTADLPGVERKDIDIAVDEDEIVVKAASGDRDYEKRIELPGRVSPASAKAALRNGILDVTVDLAKGGGKPRHVAVE